MVIWAFGGTRPGLHEPEQHAQVVAPLRDRWGDGGGSVSVGTHGSQSMTGFSILQEARDTLTTAKNHFAAQGARPLALTASAALSNGLDGISLQAGAPSTQSPPAWPHTAEEVSAAPAWALQGS